MATSFKTPGVYVQEIATLPASVAQVETAIPAFIGLTEKSVAEPKRIKSMIEFVEMFGGAKTNVFTLDIVDVGGKDEVDSAVPIYVAASKNRNLFYHMQMYFANGGGPCYVISVGTLDTPLTEPLVTAGLNLLKLEDEPTLIVIPEAIHLGANYKTVMINALTQCNTLQDRFTIMDLKGDTGDFSADALSFRGDIGTQYLKYGAAYYPRLKTTLKYDDAAVKITYNGIDTVGVSNINTAIGAGRTLAEIIELAQDSDALSFATVGKHLTKFLSEQLGSIRDKIDKEEVILGPSSAMAGVYARVDSDRGVWKAPANVSLNYVNDPTFKINNKDQEDLNVTTTGKSINAIRKFNGKGIMVWGARTLAGNDNEWRYVPVRRLFITMEESIEKATEFVVFEPNDKNTWERVRGMIENYLTLLWRQGALAGAKPEDAFFVNVGLGETMTSLDILEGKLIVEVGVAAVRPAEFIILNFSHKLQES